MEYLGLIVLFIALLVALFCEHSFYYISPWIWILGGGIEIALSVAGWGGCLWYEALITLGIVFVLSIATRKYTEAIGGGIIKGICMCSIYWGRYIPIVIIAAVIVLGIMIFIKIKGPFRKGNQRAAMPALLIANLIMVGIYYGLKL